MGGCLLIARLSRDRASSGLPQRGRQLHVYLGVTPDVRCGFERCDGVRSAALHEQCATENLQRAGIAGIQFEDLGGDAFRLAGALAGQGKRGLLQRIADVAFRHRNPGPLNIVSSAALRAER